MINETDWPKTFDGIDEFFRKCYGITSIPLAYIIRKDPTPKEGHETDWDDPLEQMIERAPHPITEANGTILKHPTFVTDNKMLFDTLTQLTREHEWWTYIKLHARARNGRAAYMAFKNHYLGPNSIGNMAATDEHKLINATYRGEGRHLDLERYATLHKEQHAILEGLKEYGYAGMDEGSKTRHLLAGIKTTAFDSVKTQILCNAELRQDFANCVVLFKDYIMQVNKPQELNVSSTTTRTEIEQIKRKPQGRIEDRYYTNYIVNYGVLLKSKSYRTGRRTLRLRFRWEC